MRSPSKYRGMALMGVFLVVAATALAQRRPPPPPRPAPPRFQGGIGGAPAMPPIDPARELAEIKALLATQPHEVFARLDRAGVRTFLQPEWGELARQAVERLASRVEVSNNRWATLSEVRTAVEHAEPFDPDVRADLGVLAALAERRALNDAVFEVRHLTERGSWSEAVRRAQEWRKRLRELNAGAGRSKTPMRDEVHEALVGLLRVGGERDALDALGDALRSGNLDKVPVEKLTPRLHDEVRGLRGLKTMRDLSAEGRLNAGEIDALKKGVESFTKCLRALPDAEPTLGARFLQELAVRHLLQGHAAEYRALMPADAPADQASRLLRDVKALSLGKGEIVTDAARQAMLAQVVKAGDPPPGIRAIMPADARKNWRPPADGIRKEEAATLERAILAGEILWGRIETDAKSERISWRGRAKDAQRSLDTALRHLRELEDADDKRFAEVADLIGWPLEVVDKLTVRRLTAQKRSDRQIAAELKKRPRPPGDAKNPRR